MNGRYVLFVWALLLAESNVFCASKLSRVALKAPKFLVPLAVGTLCTRPGLFWGAPDTKPSIIKNAEQRPRKLDSLAEYKELYTNVQEQTIAFTYTTFNIDNVSQGANDIEGHRYVNWKYRLSNMIKFIAENKPDIIGFRDIPDKKNVARVSELWKTLKGNGYKIITCGDGTMIPCDSSGPEVPLINVIAYNPKKLSLNDVQCWQAPGQPRGGICDYQSERSKASWLMATFDPIVMSCSSFPAIRVCNVVQTNLKSSEALNKLELDIPQMEKRVRSTDAVVLVGGDFKTWSIYDDTSYMEYMKKHGYVAMISSNRDFSREQFQQNVLCKQFGDTAKVAYVPSWHKHNQDETFLPKSWSGIIHIAITKKKQIENKTPSTQLLRLTYFLLNRPWWLHSALEIYDLEQK